MKIENVNIAEIRPYGKNAKKHTPEQVEAVAKSIKAFGWKQPIVVDKDGVIVIGHCRYEAAKQLGMEEIPVVRKSDLTEAEIKALRLVDNKTNESSWDVFALAGEIKGLPEYDFTDFGFGSFELLELKEFANDDTDYTPVMQTAGTKESWGVPTGTGSPHTPYPQAEPEYDDDDETEQGETIHYAKDESEPERPIEITERHIFIAYGDDEIQWLKDRLGIKGELLPAYSVARLMGDEDNAD